MICNNFFNLNPARALSRLCLFWVLSLGAPASLPGAALPATSPPSPPRIKILTSILPAYCVAANVAGIHAEVRNLLPPGVGPHDYQLSPNDMARIRSSDLIVLNGLGLDGWLRQAVNQAGSKRSKIVELTEGLGSELIASQPEMPASHPSPAVKTKTAGPGEIQANPHVWLDPRLLAHGVTNILRALQRADEVHSVEYGKNARAYLQRLHELDQEIAVALAPTRDLGFVTQHNAFPYFTRRYRLKQVGVIEEAPEVAPSPRSLAELMRRMRQERVRAIFTEPRESPKLAEQIARDLNVAIAELDTLETGELSLEAYEQGMRRNVRTMNSVLK